MAVEGRAPVINLASTARIDVSPEGSNDRRVDRGERVGGKRKRGPVKVRFPLLLIQTLLRVGPKKSIGNPIGIAVLVESSSFAGMASVVVQLDDMSTTFGPRPAAARCAPGRSGCPGGLPGVGEGVLVGGGWFAGGGWVAGGGVGAGGLGLIVGGGFGDASVTCALSARPVEAAPRSKASTRTTRTAKRRLSVHPYSSPYSFSRRGERNDRTAIGLSSPAAFLARHGLLRRPRRSASARRERVRPGWPDRPPGAAAGPRSSTPR